MTGTYQTSFGTISESNFRPSTCLKNPHLQTILPKYLLATPKIKYTYERIKTLDHDFVDLAWAMPLTAKRKPKAIVVLFHGLEGSAQSHYIKFMIEKLNTEGFGACVVHFRGCSHETNLRPISYHSGATFDAQYLCPIIKRRFSDIPLFAMGFSLGGNMLLLLMALFPELEIDRSVCVSSPLDLAASSEVINKGFSRVYQTHLMKSMKKNLLLKMTKIDMSTHISVNKQEVEKMSSFKEFDNAITAPLHGFKDAEDYYQKCSAISHLHKISKPCLVLHAKDDPFMDDRVIPRHEQLGQGIAYEYSEHGGHVGFLQSLGTGEDLWLPKRAIAFLNEHWA